VELIRPQPDPFSLLTDPAPGSRASEKSRLIARKLSLLVGEEAKVIDRYLDVLAMAPPEHLQLLLRRGVRIVFAPTIPHALLSEAAAARRQVQPSAAERLRLRAEYSPESGTAAVFDPNLDFLIFPTHYVARDLERVVLHELGHALTMTLANPRAALLEGLPAAIERHIRDRAYGPDGDPETLRLRVNEALAEAYVYVVVGRDAELPMALLSDLFFILSAVEGDEGIRFEFDEKSGRTLSRLNESRLVFPDDPQLGHLLAKRPPDGVELEARELDQPPARCDGHDELAERRSRRAA
jgi:hypothetical protein